NQSQQGGSYKQDQSGDGSNSPQSQKGGDYSQSQAQKGGAPSEPAQAEGGNNQGQHPSEQKTGTFVGLDFGVGRFGFDFGK
ncbi:hypothetical protein U1Q18_051367, partial [Sarracenia purpurea var. burkii]